MPIIFEQVTHIYGAGTPFEKEALSAVSFAIPDEAFVGIIGQTGSGKSTLVQHLNGLLKPTRGRIQVGDWQIEPSSRLPAEFRSNVGLVFQYPEHQLFEETVAKDVAFGPRNLGLSEEAALLRAKEALETVGLSYDELKDRSPFHLSGGQMRRVALAGVLAMQSKVLVLDEPTAGLDPAGRKEILEAIYRIHRERKLTTFLVTHSMEEASRYADFLLVMAEGKVVLQGTPAEVFAEEELLRHHALAVPQTVELIQQINASLPGEQQIPVTLFREEELQDYLLHRLRQTRAVIIPE
ncbi:energy-coupling factor transporter ATPase [Brevibacillus fulvus]|uniref:Energy-coupling factor transporter ATP-binding protein EcfA2 n=1 Tax=Brevibacillus fulvus TaxID=1125967 RepID=A0A938Y284_9BACL|nr:energy-coupling factor transporter ATPase [Brevibacillus fulvus]MBM7591971.1 energy-coupling factor transport system ATP-binding protein [Brevibacillus fulvus]